MSMSDNAKKAIDEAVGKMDESLRSSETAEKVAGAEDWLTEQRMKRKLGKEAFRGTDVIVYRGYGYGETAKVLVRVAESARLKESSRLPYWSVLKANVQRHWSLALAGVKVTATIGDHTVEGVTDRHGFVPLTLTVPDLAPGWTQVVVRTVPVRDDVVGEVTEAGRVFKPHPAAPFAVISDIDDTVIKSGLTEGMSSVRRTLLGDQHTRRAIPGMSSLYRGLARTGTVDGHDPGFFFVSTGSWAFFEMLTQFLQLRGFPRGPLFLTDWGPSDRYLHRSGALHKRHTIGRLMKAYPETPFVCIGDTGQGDYGAYVTAAKENPGRITLIILIPAGDEEKTAEMKACAQGDREEGVPVFVADDVVDATRLCLEAGLCDDVAREEVATELGAVF